MVSKTSVPFSSLAHISQSTSEAECLRIETDLDAERWLAHFMHNRENREEPAWNAPVTLSPAVVRRLVRSIEQFELGDGGGPDRLIAWNAERFRCHTEARRMLVDLWFAEEKEHSRLMRGCVSRFGGTPIQGHWSFSAFCATRHWLGVSFELTVLSSQRSSALRTTAYFTATPKTTHSMRSAS